MNTSGPVGHFLGIPVDGNDPTVERLRQDLRNLAGKTALMETGDWGGAAGGGVVDLKAQRIGPEPTAAQVELFKVSREDVLAACGINPSLVMDAQGTAQREAYRQFLFGTVAPLGRMVAAELSEKLDTTCTAGLGGTAGQRHSGAGAGIRNDGDQRDGD